jgi:hypothetical protein
MNKTVKFLNERSVDEVIKYINDNNVDVNKVKKLALDARTELGLKVQDLIERLSLRNGGE